jgi:hypothetical protein
MSAARIAPPSAAARTGTSRFRSCSSRGSLRPSRLRVPRWPLAALDVDRWVDEGGSFDAEAALPIRRYPDEGDKPMPFVIYKDNGGRFHWRLIGDDGGKRAISAEDFGTAEEARLAAADVHERAGAAGGTGG